MKSTKDITVKDANKGASSDKPPETTQPKKSDQNPQQDPLKWFGILVPQPLKQAQSSFKQGMMYWIYWLLVEISPWISF